ncbi:solute carrier family 2, facilitated glucose transporter member 9-like [Clarias gariepinus]
MAEKVLTKSGGKISGDLTTTLLAAALLSSLGSSMLYGYNLAVVNSPAQYIKDFYNRTAARRNGSGLSTDSITVFYSITVSIFAIGGLVGSLTVGMLVTKFGRHIGVPEMIIIGRFITGIHSGISLSVVPMFLEDIAPKNLRGFLGLVPSIFICIGVFIAQIFGLNKVLGKEQHWPLLLSLMVVPTFIQLMLLPWFPYLLIEKHNIHATLNDPRSCPLDYGLSSRLGIDATLTDFTAQTQAYALPTMTHLHAFTFTPCIQNSRLRARAPADSVTPLQCSTKATPVLLLHLLLDPSTKPKSLQLPDNNFP